MPLRWRPRLRTYLSTLPKVIKDGTPWLDPFLEEQPTLENMCVVPGSALVLVDNPVSLDGYFEKVGDWE